MSEPQTTPSGPRGPRAAQYPAELLINLIIILLTPMFLSAAGGDLAFARAAAAETLDSYRAETHADLITVAKIIAFGLAALGSLSLSMADDLPIPTILRLRNSANASDRAEHRNRLALKQNAPDLTDTPPPHEPEPEINEAALIAAAADMQQRTAANLARFSPPAAKPTPASPTPASPSPASPSPASPSNAEQRYNATWAASAAQIASETAASLASLPPEERRTAAIWVDVLNDAAKEFMAGNIPPRPKPGDLDAIMRDR